MKIPRLATRRPLIFRVVASIDNYSRDRDNYPVCDSSPYVIEAENMFKLYTKMAKDSKQYKMEEDSWGDSRCLSFDEPIEVIRGLMKVPVDEHTLRFFIDKANESTSSQ